MDRYFFWSLLTNLIFIFAMIGYLFMDTIDYLHSNIIQISLTNQIYIFLAAIFVVNASLQFLVLYHTNKTTLRYSTMILSATIDLIGSYAYLYAAFLATYASKNTNMIWLSNGFGVCAFVIAALINLMIPGFSPLLLWADYLNLIGANLYLLAFVITHVRLAQVVIIIGDFIYLIDAILYTIYWFQERTWWRLMNEEQYILLK